MPRPRTSKPRSPRHAALGQAIELVIAEDPHMTHESVAEEAGLSVKQVGSYIRGQGNPTYTTLVKLCAGLHVSLGALMVRADALLEKRLER
ncbi:MAG TPA: helix-turn-helix transcriptional regulator [Solirubrobacteraceae bacterium]|nr:helix-turn-helix transcriptional regulator [Solirubrobacteraceae bacterium]